MTAYLDEELSTAEKRNLESHLGTCPQCRQELESLRQTVVFFDSEVRSLEPGPALWDGVRARIVSMPNPARPATFWNFLPATRWAAVAAALAVVFALGFGVREYRNHQASREALDQYMKQYVQAREAQEVAHRTRHSPLTRTPHEEYLDNPFVTSTEDLSYSNPFREQGQ